MFNSNSVGSGTNNKGEDRMKISLPGFILIAIVCSAALSSGADPATGAANADPIGATSKPAETDTPLRVAPLELLAEVQRHLRTIKSVEANFVEKRHLAVLDHNVTISGHFGLQKPDRMIWVVREPSRYAVRLEGKELRQWDEETGTVQVVDLGNDPAFKSVSAQLQAWFLGNYQALAQSWDVYVVSDKPLSLRFVPKAATFVAKHMKHIEATFNQDGTNIDRMSVRETDGDQMTISFSDARLNQPIDKETWEMPPK
jgi:outer membrane lipoprotein carrier protein